jgi:hypothetical protein
VQAVHEIWIDLVSTSLRSQDEAASEGDSKNAVMKASIVSEAVGSFNVSLFYRTTAWFKMVSLIIARRFISAT